MAHQTLDGSPQLKTGFVKGVSTVDCPCRYRIHGDMQVYSGISIHTFMDYNPPPKLNLEKLNTLITVFACTLFEQGTMGAEI